MHSFKPVIPSIDGPLLTFIPTMTGLMFTPEERVSKNLTGLLPHTMETEDIACARAMKMIRSRSTNVDRYLYLSSLKSSNTDLFYRLLMDNVRELMPLVYTPTIGDVCLQVRRKLLPAVSFGPRCRIAEN